MLVAGYTCNAAGTVILAFIGAHSPYPLVGLGLLLAGGASTVVFSALTSLLMSTVSADHTGLSSGVQNTVRQSGALIAVAVFGSVLNSAAFTRHLAIAFAMMAIVEAVGIAAGIAVLRPESPPIPVRPGETEVISTAA